MASESQIDKIFHRAVGISDPQEQTRYLNEACAGNPEMMADIEELLFHDAAGDHLLDVPLVDSVICQSSELPAGTQIGPYRICEKIGEGGFGQVYIAEQTTPIRRRVALKLIKPGMDSKEILARFQTERQAMALMDHPHVANVLDAGTTPEGRPYFVMELIEGIAITEFCNRQTLALPDRLKLFSEVCSAIQHAHQKGIIHRDLKPSNVLVTLQDDQPVVKVIDFGVAKALSQPLTDYSIYTSLGQMIGTPMYMSPEQAQLNDADVDTRSDVYSLGVLLYELLTGTTPFDRQTLKKASFDEMRRIIREEEPPKPSTRISKLHQQDPSSVAETRNVDLRRLSGKLRGDLDWIVMKAMEKDRNRRYASPGKFAEDIVRFLEGQAVDARPPSVTYRFGKYARRNRTLLTSGALIVLALCIFGSREYVKSHRHLQEMKSVLSELQLKKNEADRVGKVAQQQAAQSRKTSYVSEMKLAFQRVDEGRLLEAREILDTLVPATSEADLRGVEWSYLDNKIQSCFRVIGIHPSGVEDMALFPDKKRVVSVCSDGSLSIWDIATGQLVWRYELHHRPIHAVAVSPDSKWIAYGEEDISLNSQVVMIDAETGKELGRLNSFPHSIIALDFTADGKYLVSASMGNGEVCAWEFEDGLSGRPHKVTHCKKRHSNHIRISEDGFTLLVPNIEKKQLSLWDVPTRKLIKDITNPRNMGPWPGCAYSASQQLAAIAFPGGNSSQAGKIDIVDVESGDILAVWRSFSRKTITFSPDGTSLVAGSENGWIDFLRYQLSQSGAKRTLTYTDHSRIRAINGTVLTKCMPDSNTVLVAGTDGVIASYSLGHEKNQTELGVENIRAVNTAASTDSTLFAWLGSDNKVRLTDYKTGQILDMSQKLPSFGSTLVFSPCGTRLAAQCDNQTVHCWDVAERSFHNLGSRKFGCSEFPHGDHVAIDRQNVIGFGEELDVCYLLDTDDFTQKPRTIRNAFARSVLISPDEQSLVMAFNELRIYDRKSLNLKHHVVDIGQIRSMAISRDSRWLACGHMDGSAQIRSLSSGKVRYRLNGHTGGIRAVAFSHNGKRLITGDDLGNIGFWDVESGDCYGLGREYTNKKHFIQQIFVGPGDRWLDITAGDKPSIRWTKRVSLGSIGSRDEQLKTPKVSTNNARHSSGERFESLWSVDVKQNLMRLATYSASSEKENSDQSADRAFDNSQQTRWNSSANDTRGAWLAARWEQSVKINHVVVRQAFDRITALKLQILQPNGNEWYDFIDLDESELSQFKEGRNGRHPYDQRANPHFFIPLPRPIEVTGLRLWISSTVPMKQGTVSITEFEAYFDPLISNAKQLNTALHYPRMKSSTEFLEGPFVLATSTDPRLKSKRASTHLPARLSTTSLEHKDRARQDQRSFSQKYGLPLTSINSIGMKLRLIPPGTFHIGTSPEQFATFKQVPKWYGNREISGAEVKLSRPFYIGACEVTQSEYERINGENPSHYCRTGKGANSVAGLETDRFPVDYVSWFDAVRFCNTLSSQEGYSPYYAIEGSKVSIAGGDGYRLPLEAEWEFACRAGSPEFYSFGTHSKPLPQYAWYAENSEHRPHVVGHKLPNAFGLHDMHGNLWEYTEDLLDYDNIQAGMQDPHGEVNSILCGVRGGYFDQKAFGCRSAMRSKAEIEARRPWSGFRIARTISTKGELAYDGFAYPMGRLLEKNGGHGFRKGWTASNELTKPSNSQVVAHTLKSPEGYFGSTGNSILLEGAATLTRGLETKLNLSKAGEYYLTILAKRLPKSQTEGSGRQYMHIKLMDEDAVAVMDFGVSSGRYIHMRRYDHSKQKPQGDSPQQEQITEDLTYLLLLQIEVKEDADGKLTSRSRIAGLPSTQSLPKDIRKVKWSGPEMDLPTDAVIDRLRIYHGAQSEWIIDELRIGTTYSSVTGF